MWTLQQDNIDNDIISECAAEQKCQLDQKHGEKITGPNDHTIGARVNEKDAWSLTKVGIGRVAEGFASNVD